ncbi:MAG TPA: hypothetical protein VF405_11735 [Gammaproteobacteria bacterium]
MNGHKLALAAMVALLAATGLLAQDSLQGAALRETFQLTGLGVVGRPVAGETSCGPNPGENREVPLFDSVGGQTAARLEWRVDRYSCAAFLVRGNSSEKLYRAWDHPEVDYESLGITYYEVRDGFARVFARAAPPGLWVRIADMPGQSVRPWSKVLTETPRTYRGYDGMVLHEQPREDSPVLATLRARRGSGLRVHQLVPTGELSGEWGQFEVVEFDGDLPELGPTSPAGNRWTGWLRVVDAEGAPAFWYFTRD